MGFTKDDVVVMAEAGPLDGWRLGTADDWICHRHNVALNVMYGRTYCPLGVGSPATVARLPCGEALTKNDRFELEVASRSASAWLVTRFGALLRHRRRIMWDEPQAAWLFDDPYDEFSEREMRWVGGETVYPTLDAFHWHWHVFGTLFTVDAQTVGGRPLPPITTVAPTTVGPVYGDAESPNPATDRAYKFGMALAPAAVATDGVSIEAFMHYIWTFKGLLPPAESDVLYVIDRWRRQRQIGGAG